MCGKKLLDSYKDSLDQSDKRKYNKLEVEECSCLEDVESCLPADYGWKRRLV